MPVTVTGLKEVSRAFSRFKVTKAFVSFADGAGPRIAVGLSHYAPVGPTPDEGTKPHKHLRDSIRYVRHTADGRLSMTFTSDVPQAAFVVHGTRPHSIDPVKRTFLSWLNSSGRVFARHVDHPGTQANPFPTHYWRQVEHRSIAGELHRAIQRTMAEARGGSV